LEIYKRWDRYCKVSEKRVWTPHTPERNCRWIFITWNHCAARRGFCRESSSQPKWRLRGTCMCHAAFPVEKIVPGIKNHFAILTNCEDYFIHATAFLD
jgi:hypothetical protein